LIQAGGGVVRSGVFKAAPGFLNQVFDRHLRTGCHRQYQRAVGLDMFDQRMQQRGLAGAGLAN
jgi:hypothetical protein